MGIRDKMAHNPVPVLKQGIDNKVILVNKYRLLNMFCQ